MILLRLFMLIDGINNLNFMTHDLSVDLENSMEELLSHVGIDFKQKTIISMQEGFKGNKLLKPPKFKRKLFPFGPLS